MLSIIEQKMKKMQDDSAKRSLKYYEGNKEKISQRRKLIRDNKKAGLPTPPKVQPVQVVQPVQKVQVVQPVQVIKKELLNPNTPKKETPLKIIENDKNILTLEDVEASLKNKTPSTQKTYINTIKLIKKQFFNSPINDFSYIRDDGEALLKQIRESITYKTASKKTFLIALRVISDELDLKNKKIYEGEMLKYRDENKDERELNLIPEDKKKNYDTLTNLKKIFKLMKEDTEEEIRDKLLISLYLMKPPLRNDFEKVKILKKEPDEKINFIIKQCSVYIFYLREYKTAKLYGEQQIIYSKIDDPLIFKLLNKMMKFKNMYLFTNEDGEPMTDKQISARVITLFKKYLNKHITINTLRQIYETAQINDPLYASLSFKDKKNIHEKLGHSFLTAHSDYNKINIEI